MKIIINQKQNKEQLRRAAIAARRALSHKQEKSRRVLEKLLSMPAYAAAEVIAAYASLPDEVDTQELIDQALTGGKRVVLPRIESGKMAFYEINSATVFGTGAYGIREPQSDKRVDKSSIDLALVPLLLADKEHYRLGFGGGYYDRFLKDFQGVSIGLAFQEQLVDSLPHEAHDIPLNCIVTENKFLFSGAKQE